MICIWPVAINENGVLFRGRQHVRYVFPVLVRPQARDQHYLGEFGPELQNYDFISLPLKQHTIFHWNRLMFVKPKSDGQCCNSFSQCAIEANH
jgi:hypothetical protein